MVAHEKPVPDIAQHTPGQYRKEHSIPYACTGQQIAYIMPVPDIAKPTLGQYRTEHSSPEAPLRALLPR
eukprot:1550865-Rhodomonas_salina.7